MLFKTEWKVDGSTNRQIEKREILKGKLTLQITSKLLDALVVCVYTRDAYLVAIKETWNCVLYSWVFQIASVWYCTCSRLINPCFYRLLLYKKFISLNVLGWHWLIWSYRFQVYISMIHDLYMYAHQPKSNIFCHYIWSFYPLLPPPPAPSLYLQPSPSPPTV